MPYYSTQDEALIVASIQMIGGDMQRDDDMIRAILIEMESDPSPFKIYGLSLNPSPEQAKVYHHVCLLMDAGFVAVAQESRGLPNVFRLTNAGHDFLAAARDDTIWKKIKEASAITGKAGLNILADVGVSYLKQKLAEHGFPV